jgi:hypothetical protein
MVKSSTESLNSRLADSKASQDFLREANFWVMTWAF